MVSVREGRHHVAQLQAQLILVTRIKGDAISKGDIKIIDSAMRSVFKSYDVNVIEILFGSDSVSMTIEYPPKVQISKLVMSLKCVSSRKLNQANGSSGGERQKLWASTYFAGSISSFKREDLSDFLSAEMVK